MLSVSSVASWPSTTDRSVRNPEPNQTGTRGWGRPGLMDGLLTRFFRPTTVRFYGFTENAREVEMDMREMVDKVKRGEPLYGVSQLSPHLQGVAARQSRFSSLFSDVVPWFNFVNHNQHGVDTAKYYQQAERELEAESRAKGQDDVAKLG